jgi:hypothetical protein
MILKTKLEMIFLYRTQPYVDVIEKKGKVQSDRYLNRENRAKRLEHLNKVCNVRAPWKITNV